MKYARTMILAGLAVLLTPLAQAADTPQPTATQPLAAVAQSAAAQTPATPINKVSSLPNGTEVTISGTVEDYNSRHPITLRDASGTIDVDLTDIRSIVLHNGQQVTITGDVDKGPLGGLLGTDVAATDVHL